jgi:hypothetical protein
VPLPAVLADVPVWHVAHNLVACRQAVLPFADNAMAGAGTKTIASEGDVFISLRAKEGVE